LFQFIHTFGAAKDSFAARRLILSSTRTRRLKAAVGSFGAEEPRPDVVEFRALEVNMAQFVIEREIPNAGELTETQIREISLKSLEVLGQMGPKIRWLHSYVTDNKIYCVYLAADEAAIREHAQRGGFPANRIAKVRRLIDPVNFE